MIYIFFYKHVQIFVVWFVEMFFFLASKSIPFSYKFNPLLIFMPWQPLKKTVREQAWGNCLAWARPSCKIKTEGCCVVQSVISDSSA